MAAISRRHLSCHPSTAADLVCGSTCLRQAATLLHAASPALDLSSLTQRSKINKTTFNTKDGRQHPAHPNFQPIIVASLDLHKMLLDEISQGHTVRAEQTRQQQCRCCPLPCNDTSIRTQKRDLSWSLSSASQVNWMAHKFDSIIELHSNHSIFLHHHGTSRSRPLATLLFLARKAISPASTPNPTPRHTHKQH